MQFFISHLASWLRTRRFSEPTVRPSGVTNHCKNTVFRDFPTFSRTWIFFLLRLSLSSPLLFSDSSHLCFLSVHIVGSLTSKLPSNSIFIMYLTDIYEAGMLNSKTFKAKPVCTHHSSSLISIYPSGKSRQQTPTQEPFAQPAPVCCCPFSTHVHVIFWVCNCLGCSCSYNYKCDIYIYCTIVIICRPPYVWGPYPNFRSFSGPTWAFSLEDLLRPVWYSAWGAYGEDH